MCRPTACDGATGMPMRGSDTISVLMDVCALPGIVQIRPGKLVRRAAHDRLASVSKLWFCIMAQNDYRTGPVERAAALAVHASFLEVYPPPEHLSDLLAGRLYAEPEFPYLN